jgi:hypothetical protein
VTRSQRYRKFAGGEITNKDGLEQFSFASSAVILRPEDEKDVMS